MGKIYRSLFLILSLAVNSTIKAESLNLKVGVITSLSGNWSSLGDMTNKGLTIAQEELRKQNINVELKIEDSREHVSGADAVFAYRKLRSQGLNLFIGPSGSPGGLALVPILTKEQILIVSPSVALEQFHLASSNIFNSQGAFEIASRKLAQKAYADGIRHISIFASQQPYESAQADAFAKEFVSLGGQIVSRVDPLPESTDLRTEALRLLQAKPEAIFFATYNQLAIATKEIQQLGFNGVKYAPLVDSSRFEGAQNSLNGLIFTRLAETSTKFRDAFQKKYSQETDYPADFAHDGLFALALASQQGHTTEPSKLLKFLEQVNFQGASGDFQFDKDGCVIRKPTFWKVVEGQFEQL